MLLRILLITLIAGVTGCGSSSDELPAVSGVKSENEDLIIDNSNADLTVTKTNINNVYITGDNNIVRFTGEPSYIKITGNDNTVYKPESSRLSNEGNGNMILAKEDTGARAFQ